MFILLAMLMMYSCKKDDKKSTQSTSSTLPTMTQTEQKLVGKWVLYKDETYYNVFGTYYRASVYYSTGEDTSFNEDGTVQSTWSQSPSHETETFYNTLYSPYPSDSGTYIYKAYYEEGITSGNGLWAVYTNVLGTGVQELGGSLFQGFIYTLTTTEVALANTPIFANLETIRYLKKQ